MSSIKDIASEAGVSMPDAPVQIYRAIFGFKAEGARQQKLL